VIGPVRACRSCGARIRWAVTAKGKRMPVDADPADGGNVELVEQGGDLRAVVHAQPPLDAGPLHWPHHATCPDGASWKGRR
jgi:hypothetical protein